MKSSNFLDSDSDSVPSFDSEDSSDESLPKYNICTPEKRQRILSSTSKAPGTAPRLLASPNHISTSAVSTLIAEIHQQDNYYRCYN